jgi:hypothetical protein
MDNSFSQQESDTQQPGAFLAGLQFFDGILNWLAGLIQLTEEEQTEAGIQLGDQHYE